MKQEKQSELQEIINLILSISSRFVNVQPDHIDKEIELCIAEIGAFAQVDQSYVFLLSPDGLTISNRFEWCAQDIPPAKHLNQDILTSQYQWWMDKLRNFETIHLPRISDLSSDALVEKEKLQSLGIKSVLVVPLIFQNQLMGFLGFDSIRKERFWHEQSIQFLEVIAKDIASLLNRKETYYDLVNKEKKTETLIHNIPGMVYRARKDWSVDFISNSEIICGYTEEELTINHFDWKKIIHADDIPRVFAESRVLLQKPPRSLVQEYRIIHKDGNIRWVRDHKTSSFSQNDSLSEINGIVFDITENTLNELRVEESHIHLTNVLENLPNPVLVDQNGSIIYANESMKNLIKYHNDGDLEKTIKSSVQLSYHEKILSSITSLDSAGYVEPFEIAIMDGYGNIISAIVHGTVIDYHGVPSHLFVLSDITKLKKTEQDLELIAFNLRERVKELQCLQLVSSILFRSGNDSKSAMEQIIEVIPNAFSYPDITSVQILLRGREFQSTNYQKTPWSLSSPIIIENQHIGSISVTYLEERPVRSIGPFFSEEQDLINTIAQRIAKFDELKNAHEALEEKEKTLRFTLEITRLGTWEVDWLTQKATRNHRHAQIFGYDNEFADWSPEIFLLHVVPEDREVVQKGIFNAIMNHEKIDLICRIRRRDDAVRWVTILGEAIYDENAQPVKFFGAIQDITDSKEAEDAIKQSEEKFRQVVENAPDAIFIQLEGKFVYLNPTANTLFGIHSPDQIIGTPVIDRFHPDFREIIKERIRLLNEEQIPGKTLEEILLKIDGTPVTVEVSAVPFFYQNSHGALVFLKDITERKIALTALQESEQRLALALDVSKMGTWELDLINHTAYRNVRHDQIFGHDSLLPEWTYELFLTYVIPEDREMVNQRFLSSLETKTDWEFECRIRRIDGEIAWIMARGQGQYDEHGQPLRMIGIVQDITQRKRIEEQKIQSENRLKSAMKTGKIAWWEMDMPDGTVRFDERKATMIGYKPELFHHYEDFTRLLHPEDYEPVMQAMRNLLEGKTEDYRIDYRILGASGQYYWFRDVGGITRWCPDKKPRTITGVVIDITKNKTSEELIRNSEAQYRLLADNISDVPWVLSLATGTWTYMSPSVERLTGFTLEETLQMSMKEMLTPSSYEKFAQSLPDRLSQFLSEQKTRYYTDEIEQLRKDGSTVWTEVTSRFITDKDGQAFIVGVSRDITSRKEAEAALIESKQFFEDVINFLPDPTFVIDNTGHVLAWNHAIEVLNGIAAEDMIGKGDYEYSIRVYGERRPIFIDYVLHPELMETLPQHYDNFRQEGTTIMGEGKMLHPDGQYSIYMLAASPLFDTHGQIIGAIESFRDISALKKAEKELLELNKNLEEKVSERTRSLQEEIELRKRAEEEIALSLKEKEMLLKEIHHRVKNNMQVISSLLLLQSQSIQDEQIKDLFKESMSRIKSIALVHEQLYRSDNLSMIDYSNYLNKMFHPLFDAYRADLQRIKMVITSQPVMITIEKAVPCSLIVNELISNSLKHAFPGDTKGEIRISFSVDDAGMYVLNYADSGVGFAEEPTSEKSGSLGLTLINGLTKQLGGTVEIIPNQGAHYRITFPS